MILASVVASTVISRLGCSFMYYITAGAGRAWRR